MSILELAEAAIEPIIEELKEFAEDAFDYIVQLPISLTQKAVAIIKETSLGTAIINLISAASNSDASGTDKFSAVIKAASAAYDAFVANGGFKGLIELGVSVLRQAVQFIYDEMQQAFFSKTAK